MPTTHTLIGDHELPPTRTSLLALSPRRRLIFLWLVLGSLAAGVCSLIWPAAHLGNEYLPVGNDSFYHARRILDTAANPASFYEFDTRIHVPEGSLLTWPWGYDYAMGWIVRIGIALGLSNDPMGILVWIPTAAVFISVGLVLAIGRLIGLSDWSLVLVGLCIALSPLTQYLHGVGFVDHHFAEYILVLSMLAGGLVWFADLSGVRPAIALGLVLGIAPAIHNALFILQVPILATLFAYWLQGIDIPRKAAGSFALALLLSTAAILVPSLPARMGMFEYYLLSWFHVYVACGSAVALYLICRLSFNWKNLLVITVVAGLLLAPLAYQIGLAQSFLTGQIIRLDSIAEMQSVRELIYQRGALDVSNRYSFFIWLLPIAIIYCLVRSWKERRSRLLLFWAYSVAGLVLLTTQFRLHYFGSFALYLPFIVLLDRFSKRVDQALRTKVMLGGTLALLLLYAPPMRNQLLGPMPAGNDMYFANIHPVLERLREECAKDPGVVLADNDAGHYIRFYTECSVIANNFLLTAIHEAKIREMDHLMALPAKELLREAPWIRYVLVRPVSIGSSRADEDSTVYMSYSPGSSELVGELLLGPVGNEPIPPPKEYELLFDSKLLENNKTIPYARLYRIHDQSAVPSLSGSSD